MSVQGHARVKDSLKDVKLRDRPFQPYSAALCNCLDDMHLLTPDALASGDNFSPLQQVRPRRMPSHRCVTLSLTATMTSGQACTEHLSAPTC